MTLPVLGLAASLLAVAAAAPAGEGIRPGGFPSPAPEGYAAVHLAAQAPAAGTPLASLLGARTWLNTPPPKSEDLRGRVVLVNFCTYSCINVLRAWPYVRSWADKYREHGLVVVGVHTPEFAFEKDPANVRRALSALGVRFPVVLDNDTGIWQSFNNQVWPAFYLVGPDGRVRHSAFGEGGYDRFERAIQQLLSEASGVPVEERITAVNGEGLQAAANWRSMRSEETYVGYALAKNFASPGGLRRDVPTQYSAEPALALNRWSLSGVWTAGYEFASLTGNTGGVSFRFHARDLHMVLAPGPSGRPVRFRVKVNGSPPGAHHGVDVDAEGWGSVQDARLYQLVRQRRPVAAQTFEIEFFDEGVRAYAFTFG